jgi:hypothetical protein
VPLPTDTYKSWEDVESKNFFIADIDLFCCAIAEETVPSLELKCLVVEAARQTCLFKREKREVSKKLFKKNKHLQHPFSHIVTVIWLQAAMTQLQAANGTGIITNKNMHVLLLTRIMHFIADCYVINKSSRLRNLKEHQSIDWAKSIGDVWRLAQAYQLTDLTTAAQAAEQFYTSINIDWSDFAMDIDTAVDEEI